MTKKELTKKELTKKELYKKMKEKELVIARIKQMPDNMRLCIG